MTQKTTKWINIGLYGLSAFLVLANIMISFLFSVIGSAKGLMMVSSAVGILTMLSMAILVIMLIITLTTMNKEGGRVFGSKPLIITAMILVIIHMTTGFAFNAIVQVMIRNGVDGMSISSGIRIISALRTIFNGLLFWGSFTCLMLGLRTKYQPAIVDAV